MKYVARRIKSKDRRVTLGYGVFPRWNVHEIPEQGSIGIEYCSGIGDTRKLHVSGATYRLLSMHTTVEAATAEALRLNAVRVVL